MWIGNCRTLYMGMITVGHCTCGLITVGHCICGLVPVGHEGSLYNRLVDEEVSVHMDW